ncbi:MAG: hypothetical protein R6U22_12450, partial [Desulfohalobiaceae bacterium]
MQLAISTSGQDLSAPLTGFGRASGFILYDIEKGDFSYHSNSQNMLAGRGQGPRQPRIWPRPGLKL